MGTYFNATVLLLYIFSTISFILEKKYGLALMNFGSVIFTAGLVWTSIK